MNLNMNQNQQQEQRMVLTAQMQISLKLLQMPVIEIQELIEKELDENPILEIDYENSDDFEGTNDTHSDKNERYDFNQLMQHSNNDSYINEFNDQDDDEDDIKNPFNYISRASTLKEYLMDQLIGRNEKQEVIKLCRYLIECIDENGYLTEDILDDVKNMFKSTKTVQEALSIIHDLQPWGIGARNFKESLIIQLRKRNINDEKIEDIIENHMELLADNKLRELSRILGVSVETVQRYTDLIKSLEPKPSRGFYTGETVKYIVPEAFIRKIGGVYYIIMNDDMLPKLNINTYYHSIIKENNNQETIDYIKGKMNNAMFLIRGIEQRKNTIYRILDRIVKSQSDYLDKGELYLKPMNLKDVSLDLKLHESTISRAIKDKYISVPHGTVKIKNLFTKGINTDICSEDISTVLIKKNIEKLIKDEDPRKPLSDQAICDLLGRENLNISRRTVAKYREELGIKASGKRKSFL